MKCLYTYNIMQKYTILLTIHTYILVGYMYVCIHLRIIIISRLKILSDSVKLYRFMIN